LTFFEDDILIILRIIFSTYFPIHSMNFSGRGNQSGWPITKSAKMQQTHPKEKTNSLHFSPIPFVSDKSQPR